MVNAKKEDEMTPDEKLDYLCEEMAKRKVGPEKKWRKEQLQDLLGDINGSQEYIDLQFVHVPYDESIPLRQVSTKMLRHSPMTKDVLLAETKSLFKSVSGQDVKSSLVEDGRSQMSEKAMKIMAQQGQVETFTLLYPVESNQYTSTNIYSDDLGEFKGLPLNKRAANFAFYAGFFDEPTPKFYGDVYLGRVENKPVLKNVDFTLNDVDDDYNWLQTAAMENLKYKVDHGEIVGDKKVHNTNGEEGVSKEENGYSWTQTKEEIELVIPLVASEKLTSRGVKANGLKVKYFPNKVTVAYEGKELLMLPLYAAVDVDGCTWTLDSSDGGTKLVMTCEKVKGHSWPRIMK